MFMERFLEVKFLSSIFMIYIDESLFKGSISTHMTKIALMFNMIWLNLKKNLCEYNTM